MNEKVRQRELEANNERFMKSEREIKRELRSIDVDAASWSGDELDHLARRDEELLTVKEFAMLRLHNTLKPLRARLDEATRQAKALGEQLEASKVEMAKIRSVGD